MKLTEARILVFDTETTGPDPDTCRIVELGAVAVRGRSIQERLHTYVNPGCPIPPETTEVHGITDAQVADAPTFAGLLDRAVARFSAFPLLVGYNALHFDAPLVNAELERVHSGFRLDD